MGSSSSSPRSGHKKSRSSHDLVADAYANDLLHSSPLRAASSSCDSNASLHRRAARSIDQRAVRALALAPSDACDKWTLRATPNGDARTFAIEVTGATTRFEVTDATTRAEALTLALAEFEAHGAVITEMALRATSDTEDVEEEGKEEEDEREEGWGAREIVELTLMAPIRRESTSSSSSRTTSRSPRSQSASLRSTPIRELRYAHLAHTSM